ncbi:cell division protein ZapE [Terasakiella sp. SH-1]|uniref:cell division protein ZapE n=1 Tax=Terasakiella sp. SH-1 TaxID=2560057 RepID=UPI001072F0B7|nr:cell division protein ZapE [Terasakiella sp. SH-1]
MVEGPMHNYRELLREGSIHADPAQELAVEKLQLLHHALKSYEPDSGETGWRARFGLGRRKEAPTPPQGLYIYGEVGRGKSMLTDLFFEDAPVQAKRRVHFHEFMREVHERLKDIREKKLDKKEDAIIVLAKELTSEAWLLCFDEFQVNNIADAMILGRLFETLFANGVVIVSTSNRVPDDLYKDGLQRERFLPFIDMIKEKLDVMELESPRDYRLGRESGEQTYFYPLDMESRDQLFEQFEQMTEGQAKNDYVIIKSRKIDVPKVYEKIAYFTFGDLCMKPYGANVYLELATLFDVIFIEAIPLLSPQNRNEAERFVNLIDALYEHKVKLVCSAAARPEKLYPEGDGSFEFQRTVSRLMEMQSEDYLSAQHLT